MDRRGDHVSDEKVNVTVEWFMNGEKIIATFENVTFEADEETITTTVRILEYPDGERIVEYSMTCENCGSKNWILMGSDPGEYRCSNCTGWL
jgi:hypothetical protein